jgi:hypothetical protein
MDIMTQEIEAMDISDQPELVRLAEEVRSSQRARILRRDGEDLAMLTPLQAPTKRSRKKGAFTREDPLFGLIGIGDSGVEGGFSWRKKEVLARSRQRH